MKRTQFKWMGCAVLALALPIAVMADFSGTATMAANTSLSLDTGVSGTSTGDILWTGANLTFLGTAKGAVFPASASGASIYNSLTLTILQGLAGSASATPIPASSLPVGAIFAVQTNGGNAAKALVTGVSGTSISFMYTTYGAPTTGGGTLTPTITAILNNSSEIPAGFPNSGIAPSSLFIIQGSNLANAGSPVLQDTTKGLPSTLNGASISVKVNGTTVTPAIYYTSPTQIAAELPASTPVGTGTLTVTYNNVTSAPATFQVVPSAIGIDTYNGSGVATDASTGALITYTNSAKPGETLVLWLTGIGADSADSDTTYTSTPNKINTNVQIYIAGEQVPQANIAYVGASVYPGVDVIGLTLPADVSTGCYVSLAAVSNSTIVSNIVTLPIATGSVCSDPILGTNGTKITNLGGQGTVRSGDVLLIQETMPATSGSGTTTNSLAAAQFESVTGANYVTSGSASIGSCTVNETVTATGTLPTVVPLDAGAITMTGPSGPLTLTEETTGTYFSQLAGTTIPAGGGTFVFTGSGGSGANAVGPFTATVNFPNPLVWTNQSGAATITRPNGLPITWTGGASGTYVIITGTSSGSGVTGTYTCIASASAGQFTVPSYVLLALPAGTGTTSIENSSSINPFSATGLDSGLGFGAVSFLVNSKYN